MLLFLADGAVATQVGPYSSALSVVVALLALLFAFLALRASRKRANPGLVWVALAFVVFALKNVFSAISVVTHVVKHDEIELILTVCDLAIMLLLFAPFLRRRKA